MQVEPQLRVSSQRNGPQSVRFKKRATDRSDGRLLEIALRAMRKLRCGAAWRNGPGFRVGHRSLRTSCGV